MSAKHPSNEIKITRVYDAPVKDVWDAWTDPKQVAQWWGPRGFTLTTHAKDLRPGGFWKYTMHGPDGTDYENKTLYLEVEKHAKLVYDHGGNDDRPPLFRVTVLFSDLGRQTKMDMTMTLPTPEAAQETRKFIQKAGGNSTWDRLGEYMERQKSGKDVFVINRSFSAPIETVFKAWTDPNLLSKWIPPTGLTAEFFEADIREGGRTLCRMTDGKTLSFYSRAEYLKIQKHDLIVYTQQFCDENGNVSRHPMASLWPETMLTVVNLASEGPDETRVTVTWEAYGDVSKEELEVFIQSKGGMTQGWTGSFDRLDGLVSQFR